MNSFFDDLSTKYQERATLRAEMPFRRGCRAIRDIFKQAPHKFLEAGYDSPEAILSVLSREAVMSFRNWKPG